MAFQVVLYQVSVHGISDVGLVRQNNEDSWRALKEDNFFVLADGMGGHQAGEVASKTAVEHLCYLFHQRSNLFPIEMSSAKKNLKGMIQEVNRLVYHLGRENPSLRGMGTTLCCLFLHPAGLLYAHVGDSRIYRMRQGVLEQLTKDHSLLRELIDIGQLSEQQAEEFLYKNIITKAIGTEASVEPSVDETSIEVDDLLLMCSDGLSDLVSMNEIQEVLANHPNEEALKLLVDKAKGYGGHDNITLVLVRIEGKNAPHLS